MAVKIETTYPTGRGLAATLERLDNGKRWHNDASHGAWENPAVYGDNAIALTEGSSGDKALQNYTGTTLGDMGSPGKVRIRIHEPSLSMVVGMADIYVLANVEVSEAAYTLAADFAAIPAAVEAALVADFAAIPGAVETEMALKHGDGNYVSILGSGADAVGLTLSIEGVGVPGFAVWITNDAAGDEVEAGSLATDDSGQVQTMLTDGQTYYLWANAPSGYNDLVGEEFEANSAEGNEFDVTAISAPALGSSVYDLIPLVSPYLTKCPEPVVKAALRATALEFVQESEALVEIQSVTVSEAGDTIALVSAYDCLTKRVMSIDLNSEQVVKTDYVVGEDASTGEEEVVFEYDLDVSDVLDITVVLLPNVSCYEYPASFVARWGTAISQGALAWLCSMPKKPWADPDFAKLCDRRFLDGVARAKREMVDLMEHDNTEMTLPNFE